MRILEEFYYGNIDPHERHFKKDDAFLELLRLASKNEQALTATLTEQQKETFEKYMMVHAEMCDFAERESFIRGFKLGLRFMTEAYQATLDQRGE